MAATPLIRTLYRALLRPAAELSSLGQPLRVRLPVLSSASQWLQGLHQYEKNPPEPQQIVRLLFPFLANDDGGLWRGEELWGANVTEISSATLRDVVRRRFRDEQGDIDTRVNDAFAAMRALAEQLVLARSMVVTRSGIEGAQVCVEASSFFCGKTEREPNSWLWLFQYRIRIHNEGRLPVQVLSREWLIRTGDGITQAHVPRGSPGVVGQQPVLQPGESFEYASGTPLPSPSGSIEGSLQMAVVASMAELDAAGHDGAFDVPVGCLPLHARDGAGGR